MIFTFKRVYGITQMVECLTSCEHFALHKFRKSMCLNLLTELFHKDFSSLVRMYLMKKCKFILMSEEKSLQTSYIICCLQINSLWKLIFHTTVQSVTSAIQIEMSGLNDDPRTNKKQNHDTTQH